MDLLEENNSEQVSNSSETFTFIHKLPCHSSILYCFTAQSFPQLPFDPKNAVSLVESLDISNRSLSESIDKVPEEMKMIKERRFTCEGVKAAVKVALKCKSDSGYERQQGFAENMRSLAVDMGILNTVKYILPKIPIILVLSLS
jgi:hypothetical protein